MSIYTDNGYANRKEYLNELREEYGDLVDILPLSQATVSQQLKELKSANIIQGSIEGNSICYCLNPTTLEKFKAIIGDFIELNNFGEIACC